MDHSALRTRLKVEVYTVATEPRQVATSTQVPASGLVAPPCSCCLLSHRTLLWHHRLGHPSLPRLHGMHSRLLVFGLPRSLPPLPPSPAPPCLPCDKGRQRATPHSSFPPTAAPLQTLHMDVWGQASVSGQGCERYFLLIVEDYTRYTMVFPLRTKRQVPDFLIPWIRTVRLQLREQFREDLPVLLLHSDRGGEFSSDLLQDFCRGEGILLSFTLPDTPRQNGIAEHRIGLVMEVARTSMIHAAAPHFLWPFAVRSAAQQLNLWPRVSLPETSPTPRWTGEVVDASVFRSIAASAHVPQLVDFAAAYRLDYATALVCKSESTSPPSVGGECALGTDVLEEREEDFECLAAAVPRFASMLLAPEGDPDAPDIPTPRSYAEVITGLYSSQWQAAMVAEMASWKSTGTYVDAVPPSQANIVDGLWIFRVKRPTCSPPAFNARYVARGFSQRDRVDYFLIFSPTPKITTLWVLQHVAAQRDYELHSLDFSTAFLQGSLHKEIWLRRPPDFTGSNPEGTQ
ncbi:unnamed protein product [Closterium sp. NIES-54]